jgi:hypothetical protein
MGVVRNPCGGELVMSNDNKGSNKPLSRVQAYLVEAKTCVILLREILEELKGLFVILVLLAIFVMEALHLIFK